MSYDLRVIALGAGVQSSTLYLMACAGHIGPMPDVAIFADTQAEPPWVYQQLDYLERAGSIPIHRVTAGNLELAVRKSMNPIGGRFASVPWWLKQIHPVLPRYKRGKGKRHCTREYKVDAIHREIRAIVGRGCKRAEEWVGISLDEAHRAKPSRKKWIQSRWPLLEIPMKRAQCLEWLEAHGHPAPKKSACWFCPFSGDAEWRDLRENAPGLFLRAVQMDIDLRNHPPRKLKGTPFLHDSLQPLGQVPLDRIERPNLFGNECEGMCGV